MNISRTGIAISYSAEPRFSRLARLLDQQLDGVDIFDAVIIVDVLKEIGVEGLKQLVEEA